MVLMIVMAITTAITTITVAVIAITAMAIAITIAITKAVHMCHTNYLYICAWACIVYRRAITGHGEDSQDPKRKNATRFSCRLLF